MHSVDRLSCRFDFARLHRWAWDRKVIRKERALEDSKEQKHVENLLRQLTRQLLRKQSIHHTIRMDVEARVMHVEFGQPMQILKQLTLGDNLPGKLLWSPSNSRSRVLQVPYYQEGVWCASEQFQALESFLLGASAEGHSSQAA
ncbi:MAG: hypothetical protein EP343_05990 [Deltaproteobacteria bacterium]|nr:MAG: hypothetical protein EP343_05990 [Deltaproteobacteria bacterium]